MSHANSAVSVTIDAPPDSASEKEAEQQKITWTTMTPQQISIWIDKYVYCEMIFTESLLNLFDGFFLLQFTGDHEYFSHVPSSFLTYSIGLLSIFKEMKK